MCHFPFYSGFIEFINNVIKQLTTFSKERERRTRNKNVARTHQFATFEANAFGNNEMKVKSCESIPERKLSKALMYENPTETRICLCNHKRKAFRLFFRVLHFAGDFPWPKRKQRTNEENDCRKREWNMEASSVAIMWCLFPLNNSEKDPKWLSSRRWIENDMCARRKNRSIFVLVSSQRM